LPTLANAALLTHEYRGAGRRDKIENESALLRCQLHEIRNREGAYRLSGVPPALGLECE